MAGGSYRDLLPPTAGVLVPTAQLITVDRTAPLRTAPLLVILRVESRRACEAHLSPLAKVRRTA
eukprot:14388995-Alexandrium_andersonii.AAC.1